MIGLDIDHKLEAAIASIEETLSTTPTMHGQMLDLRAMGHLEGIETLRQLIRSDGFDLLLLRSRNSDNRVIYTTLSGRIVKRAPVTGHRMIQCGNAWLVLDYRVELSFDPTSWGDAA